MAQTFVRDPRPAPETICPARPENMFTTVTAPAAYLEAQRTGRKGTAASRIEVTYTGFTPEAQAAFQYAVDIWQSLLNSPVPIRVQATWTPLAAGVLGSAGTTALYTRIDGATRNDVLYPVALAEKLAGQELNGAAAPDINARFSSTFNWYLGTDGKPGAGQYDLVSVVLHELGHGLGFQAGTTFSTTNNQGAYSEPPINFATFIENEAGQLITDTRVFTNPSPALGAQYTSNALYFDSPLARAANNTTSADKRPKLYAPTTFSSGSSISHLDEATYAAGNENSLMSPQFGAAEAIHSPGPITLAIFNEIGWFNTAIRHTPLKDTETNQDFVVNATVQSDGTVAPGTVKLMYNIDNGATTTVVMTATGTANQYRATIPSPGLNKTVRYYITAADVETGRTYASPAASRRGVINQYQFFVGVDALPPVVQHNPSTFIFTTQLPYQIMVKAKDNVGIGSVVLEYNVNGTARPNITLTRQNDTTYVGSISTAAGAIVAGDFINYRVVATDVAATPNRTANPSTGFYAVRVVSIKPAQQTYVNALDSNVPLDFVGDGFTIAQPVGFTNPAIHSDHPYKDGSGVNSESNIIYQLLVPIIVKPNAAEAVVKFDEIVLTEPNTAGSTFGSSGFFDYVIVEGSKDNGTIWTPLAPGYTSTANAAWLTRWNSAIDASGNSAATGTPDLFAPRTLNLSPTFAAGDVVRLRFRLFSDQLSHGWGWAIDNLAIQNVVTGVKEEVKAAGLTVYPNPSTGRFTVSASFAQPVKGLQVVVRNMLGQEVMRQDVPNGIRQVAVPVDLSNFSAGLYQVSLGSGSEMVSRKVLVQK
ncbi:T9SS type A sorting domain-containing protein [Hymenobacter taeanensis]|uniref:T9SS type A sorting domain-containing protein n=1 Tax=Hymenobacter taeanensis TaxID=2735321 RepID=A0A6M6BE93_9BACT|nr:MULTISPECIES: T9SS type A sorting domain-containing protein [Hymenobacter]QJX46299.1 T9SS type A sorting domain-containing protein [Hymenobacter taeanensis]UOQ80157.1 T9SS type A sorting domain-containing protein [Hymenobacter sp. 5414T-23]